MDDAAAALLDQVDDFCDALRHRGVTGDEDAPGALPLVAQLRTLSLGGIVNVGRAPGTRAHLVEAFGDTLGLSGHEVAIAVEGEGRAGIAEHALQDLDVGAGGDGQGRTTAVLMIAQGGHLLAVKDWLERS